MTVLFECFAMSSVDPDTVFKRLINRISQLRYGSRPLTMSRIHCHHAGIGLADLQFWGMGVWQSHMTLTTYF